MRAVVVGSGAGGAMAARHLAASGFEVLLLEAGSPFKALTRRVMHAGALRQTGLLGSERTISLLFPHMRTSRSGELVTVRGVGAGGCTVLSCGNMVPTDKGLREIGLDLGKEFEEVRALVPTCTVARERWRPISGEMFDAATRIGLSPELTPKAMDIGRCTGCGMCELGCASGARWDSRAWVVDAVGCGAKVLYGHQVTEVMVENGRAVGVRAETPSGSMTFRADTIVLAAGGIGTAQVLLRSGVEVSDTLWIDPVITFGGVKQGARQLDEVPMAWYSARENYMISPYLDLLSHFFQPSWRKVGVNDRVGVMIKLADEANGSVDAGGKVTKALSMKDQANIAEAALLVEGLMSEAGVKGPITRGLINGGHLGGTLPLRREEVARMRPGALPDGLWVADLSLVPQSQGMPTMMLAAAMALRVSREITAAAGLAKTQGSMAPGRG